MEEVYPDIFLIRQQGGFGPFKPEVNVYVLAGGDGLIFDAGYGDRRSVRRLVAEIEKIGRLYSDRGRRFRITRVLPSHAHPDHFSGLRSLRKHTGAKVLLTESMFRIIRSRRAYEGHYRQEFTDELRPAETVLQRTFENLKNRTLSFLYARMYGITYLNDPEEIIQNDSIISINGEPWRVFPSPGHSSDHISLYNPGTGVLFSGDNILRAVTTWLGPPESDLNAYRASMEYINSLEPLTLILGAHGGPIRRARERITEIVGFREKRIRQVLEIVRNSGGQGITAEEVIRELYPRDGRIKREIARGWVVLTLKELEKQGLLARRTDRGSFMFSIAGGSAADRAPTTPGEKR